MISPDERIQIGLKVLERLKPQSWGRQALRLFSGAAAQPGVAAGPRPSLQALLQAAGPLPSCSAVLGACEDGLPFLLDLTNPAPGSFLIAGDPGSGKTRLLQSLLASLNLLNAPEELVYILLAANPLEYSDVADGLHCQETALDARQAGRILAELCETVSGRRYQGEQGPLIVLVIDDLPALVQGLDAESFARLPWLARHGPRSGVWTFAALQPAGLEQTDPRLLEAFRTRLVGKIGAARPPLALTGSLGSRARELSPGSEFCAPFGDDWVHFWVCDLAEPDEPQDKNLD